MSVQTVYDHVADFNASMDPKRVLEMKASETMSIRLEDLIDENASYRCEYYKNKPTHAAVQPTPVTKPITIRKPQYHTFLYIVACIWPDKVNAPI